MRHRVATVCIPLVVTIVLAGASPALGQDRGNHGWFVRAGGYLWMSNVDGANRAASVDIPVTDSVLEPSWAARLEIGRWRLRAIIDVSRSNQANPLVPIAPGDPSGSYDFTMTTLEVRGAAHIGPFASRHAVEIFAGVRSVRQDQRFELTDPIAVQEDVTEIWTEPMFGSRYFAQVGRRFWFTMLVDVGGLEIGSAFTWVLDAELGFQLAPPVDLTFRYRYMETQYDNGRSGAQQYVWDSGQVQGWFFGLVYNH